MPEIAQYFQKGERRLGRLEYKYSYSHVSNFTWHHVMETFNGATLLIPQEKSPT